MTEDRVEFLRLDDKSPTGISALRRIASANMFGKTADCIPLPQGKFRPPVSDKVDEKPDPHVPTVSSPRRCLEHPFLLLLPMTSMPWPGIHSDRCSRNRAGPRTPLTDSMKREPCHLPSCFPGPETTPTTILGQTGTNHRRTVAQCVDEDLVVECLAGWQPPSRRGRHVRDHPQDDVVAMVESR